MQLKVAGRQSGKASKFTAEVLVYDGLVVLRTDDANDGGFWHEITLTEEDLRNLLSNIRLEQVAICDDPETCPAN